MDGLSVGEYLLLLILAGRMGPVSKNKHQNGSKILSSTLSGPFHINSIPTISQITWIT